MPLWSPDVATSTTTTATIQPDTEDHEDIFRELDLIQANVDESEGK